MPLMPMPPMPTKWIGPMSRGNFMGGSFFYLSPKDDPRRPKSDVSDLGNHNWPNSGTPEFGRRGSGEGVTICGISLRSDPPHPIPLPCGEREENAARPEPNAIALSHKGRGEARKRQETGAPHVGRTD